MVRTATATLMAVLGIGAVPGAAWAACTASERLRLYESGFDALRVKEFCEGSGGAPGSKSDPPGTLAAEQGLPFPDPLLPLATHVCSTQLGLCQMFPAVPVGDMCFCASPFGPVFGLAQ